jgi:hypothetical protein
MENFLNNRRKKNINQSIVDWNKYLNTLRIEYSLSFEQKIQIQYKSKANLLFD